MVTQSVSPRRSIHTYSTGQCTIQHVVYNTVLQWIHMIKSVALDIIINFAVILIVELL